MAELTLDQHGRRRHPRPARGRLPPLRGRRDLAGPALREDAVRQRPARARLPPGLRGDGGAPPRRGRRLDARLPRARAAAAPWRVRVGHRRRHRRGRGIDVRLDAAERCGSCSATMPRSSRRCTTSRRQGNFEGATVLSRVLDLDEASTRSGVPAERLPELRRRMLEARAPAAAARARRQGARILERHGARGARRGRARARAAPTCSRRPSSARSSCSGRCPVRTARSGAPIERAAARCRASWTTTRRLPRGCGSSTARRSIRAG